MVQRKFLTGLALALLAAQACGSDDGKKTVRSDADAGMAGQAGSPEPNAGGSSAGETPSLGGEPGLGGNGGSPPEIVGGAGGVPQVELPGGAGGQPSPAAEPELLFTVRNQGGSPGLPGTALSSALRPQNVIYTSSTGSQEQVLGTNAVKVTGAELGLLETDPIVAFSLVQPEPAKPLFLFSVADGTQGATSSRVYSSFHDVASDEQSHLYYSEGAQSTRFLGEEGDEYGYNAIFATQTSLGLAGYDPDGPAPDDLIGLVAHDARQPLGDIYFTVAPYATGVDGSGISTVPTNERGCTVFKSAGDGTNSVAFGCDELGLAIDDRIDGLALWGDATPSRVLFSVGTGAQGAVGTAVEAAAASPEGAGATLFSSLGDGSNTVLKSARDLGLGEPSNGQQEIDGFTVVDAPAAASVARAGNCELAYDPLDAASGGGLASLATGVAHVGSNVVVLFGQTSTQTNRLIAYNATTCAFLQQKDLPSGFEDPRTVAIVPLAGWAAGKPLDKVEYLGVTDADIQKAITRYDAAGEPVASFPIAELYYDANVSALVHEPLSDRLYLLVQQYLWQTLFVMPRPSATDTGLTASYRDLTTPCANEAGLSGTDALGNLLLTKRQTPGEQLRVCSFTPSGELVPLPSFWSVDPVGTRPQGFMGSNGSFFVVHDDQSPISIERGVQQAP